MNMVLAERNSEIMRNGRSRGPSPNGHNGTPDSSSDEDSSIKKNGSKSKTKQSEYEEKIRVGRDYQAVCPDLIPSPERKPELLNDRALLVWSPTKDIPDTKLEEYISVAKEKYGYNGEQALGMLFWHKHDLERAVMDLANFTPFPDEWSVEDKVLFEQAFQFHGKSFHRIRQMLPDKSIASLVKYYYSWKKTRHRQSVMDRQEKAKLKDGGSDNGSENVSNDESENEEKVQTNKQHMSSLKRKISTSSEDLRPNEQNNRINSRWNNEELLLAVHGIKKFGKDFQAIAETIGNKTEAHIRTFFVNYRRRYNLDAALKEHESEKEARQQKEAADAAAAAAAAAAALAETTTTLQQQSQQLQQQLSPQQNNDKNNADDDEVIEIPIIPTRSEITAETVVVAATTTTTSTSNQQQQQPVQLQQSQQPLQLQKLQPQQLQIVKQQLQQGVVQQQQQQENIIVEIDLESETSFESPPPKKPALSILSNSETTIKTSI